MAVAGTRAGMQWQQNQSTTIIPFLSHFLPPPLPPALHNFICSNPSQAIQIFGNNCNELKLHSGRN